MLIGYDLPIDWALAITSGTWVTPEAALQDRSPSERTRVQWPSGSQHTAVTVAITGARSRAFVPRLAALLGTTLPAGLRVEIRGKRATDAGFTYELGGNALTRRTVEFDDGSVGCIWAFADDLDPILAWQLLIYNDVDGVPGISASAYLDLGEIVVCPAVDVPHRPGRRFATVDASPSYRLLGGRTIRAGRTAYRVLTVRPMFDRITVARGRTLPGDMDWGRLQTKLSADPWTLVVLTPWDLDLAQYESIYGVASRVPSLDSIAGSLNQLAELVVEEEPA